MRHRRSNQAATPKTATGAAEARAELATSRGQPLVGRVLRWFAALGTTVAVSAAIPMLLLAGPSPLDPDRGAGSIVDAVLTGSQVFDEAVVSVVVAVGWAAWAYLLVSALVALVGVVRGTVVRVAGFGFGQRLVAPVVHALMWSSTATSLAMSVVGGGALSVALADDAMAQDAVVEHVDELGTSGEGVGPDGTGPIEQIGENMVLVAGQVARGHVTVVDGDTMWDLAGRHLGDEFRWTEIADLNVGRPQPVTATVTNPDLIWPGTVLLMPDGAVGLNAPTQHEMDQLCAAAGSIDSSTGTESLDVIVERGDTMWDIADEHLGDPFRWPEIAHRTVGKPQLHSPTVTDPDLIWPGTVLHLPGTASHVAEQDLDCGPEPEASEVVTDEVAPAVVVPVETTPPPMEAPREVSEVEPVVEEASGRNGIPWWLLAAGVAASAVFAEGLRRSLARRRARAAALGEEPVSDDLLDEFDPPARSTRDHLMTAVASLARWVTTSDAVLFQVDTDRTSAVFLDLVEPPAHAPWRFGSGDENACTWWLAHDEADGTDGSHCLWGFGQNVFFNLEALGVVGVEGPDDELVLATLRHMIHDVVGNFGHEHDVIVRVGEVASLDEIACYGVTRSHTVGQLRAEIDRLLNEVDELHGAAGTNLMAELRDDDAPFPTLLVVLSADEADELRDLGDRIAQNPGRFPVVLLLVGSGAQAAWTVRVESAEVATIGSERLGEQRLSDVPNLMDRARAIALSSALGGRLDPAEFAPTDDADATGTSVDVIADDPIAAAMAETGIEADMVVWLADDEASALVEPASPTSLVGGQASETSEDADESDADADGESGSPGGVSPGIEEAFVPEDVDEVRHESASTSGPLLDNPVRPGVCLDGPGETEGPEVISPAMTPDRLAGFNIGSGSVAAFVDPRREALIEFMRGATVGQGSTAAQAEAGAALLAWFGTLSRQRWVDLLWSGREVSPRRVRGLLLEIRRQWGPAFSDKNGVLELRASTDVGVAKELIGSAVSLPWPAAKARLCDAARLCGGEPLGDMPDGRWYEWTGIDAEAVRVAIVERLVDGLCEAARRARSEADDEATITLCEAARRVSPVAQAPVELLAQTLAQAGRLDRALEVVEDWETRFALRFDEEAPDTLRQGLTRAT